MRNGEIKSRVLFSETPIRQIWEDLFLSQAKSELVRQEHQVGSLNNCISDIESRREQVRLQEELSLKEKVLRDTQIRSIHEMGEMKRAQEL